MKLDEFVLTSYPLHVCRNLSQNLTLLPLPLGSLASSLLISCPSLQSSFNFSCTSHPCHHLRHPPHNLLVCSSSTFSLLQSRAAHYIHAQHYMHGVNSAAHYILDIRSSLIFPALCSITTPFLLLFSFSILIPLPLPPIAPNTWSQRSPLSTVTLLPNLFQ